MKIALCQINPILGFFDYNQKLIEKYYQTALDNSADLIVFPEMSITGYPPQDLLLQEDFIKKNEEVLHQIAKISTVPMIVGYVRSKNTKLFNSAALCQEGKVCYIYDKILLPTYDVFDESRYFTPGVKPGIWSITVSGKEYKIGIQICEDLWDSDYDIKVMKQQKKLGADLIINTSASPYSKNRLKDRVDLIKNKIKDFQVPVFYCNLIGAQDELVFDGCSIAFDGKGGCIGQAKSFQEDILLIDFNDEGTFEINYKPRIQNIFDALCLGIKDYFYKTANTEAVVGLSGGIDSAIVATLACHALGSENVHGVSMPSKYSSQHSKDDAKQLALNLEIDYMSIPIHKTVNAIESALQPKFQETKKNTAEENIQARARGNILMALSNKFGWLVLSTGNKTELALGYCTLYGDMSGGLSVISDLNKSDVYALANWVNENISDVIPQNTIAKPPSAELAPNQVDPFDYDLISPLVDAMVEKNFSINQLIDNGYDKDIINDTYERIIRNEYKRRQAPIGIRISQKAFGVGRRFPVVNHYMEKK